MGYGGLGSGRARCVRAWLLRVRLGAVRQGSLRHGLLRPGLAGAGRLRLGAGSVWQVPERLGSVGLVAVLRGAAR